ncbi:hypothetical protein ACHAWX_001226 [Stephanocyclus meneghinianus]
MPGRYDEYDWNEIKSRYLASSNSLAWSKFVLRRGQLPPEARDAAEKLGYTEALWDNGEEPQDCDKLWNQLSEEQKVAAGVLGYDEEMWNAS